MCSNAFDFPLPDHWRTISWEACRMVFSTTWYHWRNCEYFSFLFLCSNNKMLVRVKCHRFKWGLNLRELLFDPSPFSPQREGNTVQSLSLNCCNELTAVFAIDRTDGGGWTGCWGTKMVTYAISVINIPWRKSSNRWTHFFFCWNLQKLIDSAILAISVVEAYDLALMLCCPCSSSEMHTLSWTQYHWSFFKQMISDHVIN